MKKLYITIITLLACQYMMAQTTATNFTKTDCNGKSHTLFDELDSGYVVVLFFEMGCNSCVTAAQAFETKVYTDYQKSNPGKVRCYYLDYNSGSTCNDVESWKSSNGLTFPSFADAGSLMTPYGFGMPLVVIAGGKNHKVTYKSGWNETKVRTGMTQAMNEATAVATVPSNVSSANVFPNPTSGTTHINLELDKTGKVEIALYNMTGQKIEVLYNTTMLSGKQNLSFDTQGLASGLYYITVRTENGAQQIPLQVTN